MQANLLKRIARFAYQSYDLAHVRRHAKPQFEFRGRSYDYMRQRYNNTWGNERTVEIPIALALLKDHSGKKVLEIGNVLSHYVPISHEVVDKYERAPGVINHDIVDYAPGRTYDLILTISTLEHVGADEVLCDPDPDRGKVIGAFSNLRKLLAPGGLLFVTLPMGQNPYLDELLRNGTIKFGEKYGMRRISADNEWREASWEEIRYLPYGHPWSAANAVVFGYTRG